MDKKSFKLYIVYLMAWINKLYGESSKKTYYACSKKCPLCIEWQKPSNLWKTLEFFPYHCPGCLHAGYGDEFYVIGGNTFVCLTCKTKYNKFLKKMFKKDV